MPDVLTSPTPTTSTDSSVPAPAGLVVSTPDVAQTPAKPSIADATKAYLASLTPDAASQPLAEPAPVADTPESLAADLAFEPPVFDQATGKWRNKDGTFAEAPATDAPATETPADGEQAAPAEEAAPVTEPETPAIRVELKDRNGNVVPIEVTDQQTAELLQANARDGLRRDEFNRRISSVEQREAELRAFETALKTNPDEVVLSRMPADAQARIAVALIAQHWDAIYPQLEQMAADPSHRIVQATQAQLRQATQRAEFERVRSAEQRGVALENAVRTLVPESVDQATADRFLRDAVSDLTYHMQQQDVRPEDVASLLAPRVALYGFRADASSASAPQAATGGSVPPIATSAPAAPAAPAIPVARPVVASAAVSASAASGAGAQAAAVDAARIAQQQQARARAAASAPAGAGAPPVSVRVPVEATRSIEDASKYLRANVRGW